MTTLLLLWRSGTAGRHLITLPALGARESRAESQTASNACRAFLLLPKPQAAESTQTYGHLRAHSATDRTSYFWRRLPDLNPVADKRFHGVR
jgi:hypothetical protein